MIRPTEARNVPIQCEVILEKMKKMKLTHTQTADLIGITPQRFKDCLKSRQKHRFSEDEIVTISVKLALRITEILTDPDDIVKFKELKRIAVSDAKMMKYYTKWHKQEPPQATDCRGMKSPAEIVKADKRNYNPLKTAKLPEKPDDPNKTYIIDSMGTRVLSEEVRKGIKIVYRTL